MRRFVRGIVALSVIGGAALAACSAGGGEGRPLPAGTGNAAGTAASGGTGGSGGTGALGGFGGGATGGGLNLDGSLGDGPVQDGDACGSATIPSDVEITPGNVLVLFDQSLTMGDPWQDPNGTSLPKWQAAGNALIASVGGILADLNLGAIFFPTTAATSLFDLCSAQSAPITSAPPQIPI